MDMFTTHDGREVDLDNLETWLSLVDRRSRKLLTKTASEIQDECQKELGYANVWLKYIYPSLVIEECPSLANDQQMERVDALGKEFAALIDKYRIEWLACHQVDDDSCRFLFRSKFSSYQERDEHCRIDEKYRVAWLKLHLRILDETENMC